MVLQIGLTNLMSKTYEKKLENYSFFISSDVDS